MGSVIPTPIVYIHTTGMAQFKIKIPLQVGWKLAFNVVHKI